MGSEVNRLIAGNIRAERGRRGWLQADVADRMDGWAKNTVSAVEGHRRLVGVAELLDLALIFDVPLRDLLKGLPDDVITRLGI